jgi:hypothetical protein
MYYTFEVPLDRGPAAWERYASEQIQLGPYSNEDDAWIGLGDTIGDERASLARIVRRD